MGKVLFCPCEHLVCGSNSQEINFIIGQNVPETDGCYIYQTEDGGCGRRHQMFYSLLHHLISILYFTIFPQNVYLHDKMNR